MKLNWSLKKARSTMKKDTKKSDFGELELALGVKLLTKTVLLPISVPYGDYCWKDYSICEYFDNTGGTPFCKLGFNPSKYDINGHVSKPEECKKLKEG